MASEGILLFSSDTYKKPLGGLKQRSDVNDQENVVKHHSGVNVGGR